MQKLNWQKIWQNGKFAIIFVSSFLAIWFSIAMFVRILQPSIPKVSFFQAQKVVANNTIKKAAQKQEIVRNSWTDISLFQAENRAEIARLVKFEKTQFSPKDLANCPLISKTLDNYKSSAVIGNKEMYITTHKKLIGWTVFANFHRKACGNSNQVKELSTLFANRSIESWLSGSDIFVQSIQVSQEIAQN
jgi:hypothetical protein